MTTWSAGYTLMFLGFVLLMGAGRGIRMLRDEEEDSMWDNERFPPVSWTLGMTYALAVLGFITAGVGLILMFRP